MLDVASIADQNRMDINEFYRQLRIWEKRATQRIDKMKQRNGR